MDVLNKTFAQLSDLFKSLSPGARITAGLLLVMVVVSVAYLFRTQVDGADAYLMGGEPFSASHLPSMEAAFAKAGLASYEIEGNRIKVPRGQQSAYMGALADDGALPPDFGKYLEKALANNGPFVSRAKQQDLLRIAKQNELQLILCRMKGVESASVLYDEKKTGGFGQKTVCTASVNIKPMGSGPLEEARIPMIRHLVASAFAGLNPNSVSVTDLNGRNYSAGGEDGSLGTALEDPYISRKHKHEQMWEQKIHAQLEYIPGVVVSTNVELSLDTEFEETKTSLDPKGVIYSSDESSTSRSSEAGGVRGRVGLTAQQPGGANQPGAVSESETGNKTSEETSKVSTHTAVPTTVQKRRQQGLTPERVKVAVAVPTSYYNQVWQERNPAAEGKPAAKPDAAAIAEIERQVKDDIKNAVVALLPIPAPGEDPFPQVTVTSFQHITTVPPAPPAIQDHAMAWLGQYWPTLAVCGLGLMSLLMLRSLVRSTPAPVVSSMAQLEPAPAPSLSLVTSSEPYEPAPPSGEAPPSPRARLKRRVVNGGPSLQEELAALVKEDPDSAVAVLKNWIGASA